MNWLKKIWKYLIIFVGGIGTALGLIVVFLFSGKKKFDNGLDEIDKINQEKRKNEEAINNINYNDVDSAGKLK